MNANSYSSPSTAGGNREWLGTEAVILEPEKSPLYSAIKKTNTAKGTFYEAVADRLAIPSIAGTREGDDGGGGGNEATQRQRFGAYLHRWMKSFSVTDVQQAVSRAGGVAVTDDEFGYAKMKAMREIKRNMEATISSVLETQGGSDDEMKLRGAFKWLSTSAQTPAVPATFRTASGQVLTSKTAVTEADLNGVLKTLVGVTGGAEDYLLIAGNDYVEDIDLFTVGYAGTVTGATYTYPVTLTGGGKSKELNMSVNIFKSSFGRLSVVGSQFLNINTTTGTGNALAALVIKPETWELNFLEELHQSNEEESSGGMSADLKAIGGLFCTMPRANGYITDTLNTNA